MRWLATRITSSRLARLVLAFVVVIAHLVAVAAEARLVFRRPFVLSGPGPSTGPSGSLFTIANWKRLAISSWDSGQYIFVALKGYAQCPKQDMRNANFMEVIQRCNVNFYPPYGFAGGLLARVLHIPVDWALFLISVACGLGAVYLFTSKAIVSALGATETLIAVYLFAIFPSAFYIVTIMTESPMLLAALGAFVLLRNRWYLLGALVAGVGTGLHFRGTGIGIAYGAALLFSLLTDAPKTRLDLARRVLALLTCCWGGALLTSFYWWKYSDPLLYMHSAWALRWVPGNSDGTTAYSIFMSFRVPYAGFMIMMIALLCSLSARSVLKEFRSPERVYMILYTGFLMTSLVSRGGDWLGIPRYIFSIFPLFLVMARTFRGRTAALAIWTVLCLLHYWHVELCWFLGHQQTGQCLWSKYI